MTIADKSGLVWAEDTFEGLAHSVNAATVPAGRYVLKVTDDYGVVQEKSILIKRSHRFQGRSTARVDLHWAAARIAPAIAAASARQQGDN